MTHASGTLPASGKTTMAQLKITDQDGKERVHELVDELTTVGRASGNIIQVSDEKASRHHFRIEKVGERFRLVDLGSTNGTKLNGIKLQGDVFLRPGDKVGLGRTVFLFDDPNAPKLPEPAGAAASAPPAPAAPPAPPPKVDAAVASEATIMDVPKYVLKVLEGANAGHLYELGTKPITIGRHASNTIQINDDATSNYHAEISKEPIGFVVTDLGSTNGTRVKVKQKSEFEKVVKTPLSVGMQIKVGKTVLEFQNIGKQVEDEALFGTVALEPDKLEKKLAAEPSRGVPMPLLVLLAMAVFAGVVYGVVHFVKPLATVTPPENTKKVAPVDTSNKIANGDFSQGTDDEGNPKDFQVVRGSPGVKVEVSPEAAHDPAESPKPLGLRVNKSGKSPSALTAVETASTFALDSGKVYEFGGWMRNDGDGLFGLRVTWLQGERKFSENPVVLKDTQEWKEKSATLTPPSWAQRARVGVFVQGKDGKTCFDDLVFREKPGGEAAPAPAVRFGAVGISFEGSKGMFTGTLAGETVIEDGNLMLVSPDGMAISDLGSAVDPRRKAEPNLGSYDGRLYDFAAQELTNYLIQAQQGAQGVELKVAVDKLSDAASAPQIRFYLSGNVAQGDMEYTKHGAPPERVAAAEGNRTLEGIEELLFNAGKLPQLDLLFSAKPANVDLRREGKRRCVTISFSGELQVALAAESVGQKRQMEAALGELRKAMTDKHWGDADARLKPFRDTFASRFLLAREETARANGLLDSEWRKMQDDVRILLAAVQAAPNADAANAALVPLRAAVERHKQAWAGAEAERLAPLDGALAQADVLLRGHQDKGAEKDAEKWLKDAETYYEKKVYAVARSILTVKIINDPALGKTKAAGKAKELLPKVEAAERRQLELRNINDRLVAKTRNYIQMEKYKEAIEVVEKDKEYQDNRAELTDLTKLLDEWRKKVPP